MKHFSAVAVWSHAALATYGRRLLHWLVQSKTHWLNLRSSTVVWISMKELTIWELFDCSNREKKLHYLADSSDSVPAHLCCLIYFIMNQLYGHYVLHYSSIMVPLYIPFWWKGAARTVSTIMQNAISRKSCHFFKPRVLSELLLYFHNCSIICFIFLKGCCLSWCYHYIIMQNEIMEKSLLFQSWGAVWAAVLIMHNYIKFSHFSKPRVLSELLSLCIMMQFAFKTWIPNTYQFR